MNGINQSNMKMGYFLLITIFTALVSGNVQGMWYYLCENKETLKGKKGKAE